MKLYPITLLIIMLMSGCSSMQMGHQIVANPKDISGTYNLILVGGTFGSDAERLAILDIEDDNYTFRPVTGPGRVKNFPGITAANALDKVEEFFADHCAYRDYQVRELSLPDHGQIGYELLPDYPTALCADGNELSVSYGDEKNGEIKVYTWLLLPVNGEGNDIGVIRSVR